MSISQVAVNFTSARRDSSLALKVPLKQACKQRRVSLLQLRLINKLQLTQVTGSLDRSRGIALLFSTVLGHTLLYSTEARWELRCCFWTFVPLLWAVTPSVSLLLFYCFDPQQALRVCVCVCENHSRKPYTQERTHATTHTLAPHHKVFYSSYTAAPCRL